eukprot:3100916-Rhodomonas_salina.3
MNGGLFKLACPIQTRETHSVAFVELWFCLPVAAAAGPRRRRCIAQRPEPELAHCRSTTSTTRLILP